MSILKFNQRRHPWLFDDVSSWVDADTIFGNSFFTEEMSLPAMNVKEKEDNFEVELAVPGFSKDTIKVSLENDLLHVCAEKSKDETEEKEEGYTRREFSYNQFDRKLKLPSSVDQNQEVKAVYRDGVLTLNLFKKVEATEPPKKMIEIT